MSATDLNKDQIIIEFQRVGNYVRVSAMHVPTRVEVFIVGSPHENEKTLRRTVIAKLRYVLKKGTGR